LARSAGNDGTIGLAGTVQHLTERWRHAEFTTSLRFPTVTALSGVRSSAANTGGRAKMRELTSDEIELVAGGQGIPNNPPPPGGSTHITVGISQRNHASASIAQFGGSVYIGGGYGATATPTLREGQVGGDGTSFDGGIGGGAGGGGF
jgi:hypothetical protein